MFENVGSSLTKLFVKLTHKDCCIVSMRRNRTRTISCKFLFESRRHENSHRHTDDRVMHQPNGVSGRQLEQSMFFSFLVSMQVSDTRGTSLGEMIIPDGLNVLILSSVQCAHKRAELRANPLSITRESREDNNSRVLACLDMPGAEITSSHYPLIITLHITNTISSNDTTGKPVPALKVKEAKIN